MKTLARTFSSIRTFRHPNKTTGQKMVLYITQAETVIKLLVKKINHALKDCCKDTFQLAEDNLKGPASGVP